MVAHAELENMLVRQCCTIVAHTVTHMVAHSSACNYMLLRRSVLYYSSAYGST